MDFGGPFVFVLKSGWQPEAPKDTGLKKICGIGRHKGHGDSPGPMAQACLWGGQQAWRDLLRPASSHSSLLHGSSPPLLQVLQVETALLRNLFPLSTVLVIAVMGIMDYRHVLAGRGHRDPQSTDETEEKRNWKVPQLRDHHS